MPDFKRFSRDMARTREEPMFTLQARGLLSLNNVLFRALGEPDAVQLLYDAQERIIALEKAEKDDPDAYKVRKQSGTTTYLVGLQGFLTHHGIKTVVAQRFPAHEYDPQVWGLVLTEGRAVTNRRGAVEQPPAFTERWRATSNGFEVPSLMRIGDVAFSHPGYMTQAAQQHTPPSMRVGALVASEPLGPELPTSDLRGRFLDFLKSPAIMDLVSSVTCVDPGVHWTPWGGHGRINLETALAGDTGDAPPAPVASAMLLLPEDGNAGFGRDTRFAQLVLHIQPRSAGGGTPEPVNIPAWHARFTQALKLPRAMTGLLTEGLGLKTVAEPPAQVGVWLKSYQIEDLVALENLTPVAGTQPTPWFMGWALADGSGAPAEETAVELLRQMCDYTLHLDHYEQLLGSLLIT